MYARAIRMSTEFKDRFRRNFRALGICGIVLVTLAFIPWVDRSHEIGTGTPFVYTSHLSTQVQEFMRSEDFVAGSKGTTHIPGYEVRETFPIGDGIVLAGVGAVIALLGFFSARQAPDRWSAIVGLSLGGLGLLALGFAAVLPNLEQDGVGHTEPSAPAASTWFNVSWDPAIGVWLASLVLLFAAWKVTDTLLLSMKRASG